MLNTSFDRLTAAEQTFVSAVCADLNANRDAAQLVVLGDGSAAPNGERYAAKRLGHSWTVVFNFPHSDTAHHQRAASQKLVAQLMDDDRFSDVTLSPQHCLLLGWTDAMPSSGHAAWFEALHKNGDWVVVCAPDQCVEHAIKWAPIPEAQ